MVTLAGRAGVTVSAHVVARGDEFVYEEGLTTILRHVPKRYSPPAGELVAAYAVATMPDKQRVCVVLRREDVEERRDAGFGKGGNAGPWKDHTAEMWRKTALRQVWKMIPQSAHLERAAIADRVERGQPLTLEADELVARGLPEVGPALRASREPGDDDETGEVVS
jgi:recombination protein RecT